ncbi:hypothetical protein GGR56DRAFT_466800 [Xylariaceae sp. FL0804]|nr:hypothetical protein GGR56DRAFT_466800 [Xylariaceae sp. FL0804]
MAHSHLTGSHPKKPCDISNMMSPPELPRVDSFSHNNMSKNTGPERYEVPRISRPLPPLSPPISPALKLDDQPPNLGLGAAMSLRDPILYPLQDLAYSPPQQPLFPRDDTSHAQRIVDDHMLARPAELFKEAAPPERTDYELVLFFRSAVMQKFKESPRSWLQRERALLLADREAAKEKNKHYRFQHILPAKPQPIRREAQRMRTSKDPKIVKSPQRPPRPIRSGPVPALSNNIDHFSRRVPSETPDPTPRRAAAPNRVDTDYNALPDYCPPISSLPNKANCLKVDWKGNPTDLSNDPDRHLLHPDELSLASNLRLNCATYLTSKRRIFIRRLECLRMGKEFRRTDAQQACKIDVNKASKLWAAFEKVGWLSKAWMADYF